MKCPKCDEPRDELGIACRHCGIVFHKYESYLENKVLFSESQTASQVGLGGKLEALRRYLSKPPDTMAGHFTAYALLWAVFVVWGFSYLLEDIATLGNWSNFLHNVNLPFHEAGHLFFGLFGDFVGSLGGTLGQLLMPIVAGIALLRSRADTFGASLCLWWFGENFLDVAPYMADARAGELLLLGGNHGKSSPYGFHDWEFILGETGLLGYDTLLAAITLNVGRAIMLVAMLWGGYLLWRARP